jgi:tetratricopeptide (TPR) repeat protein
VETAGKGNEQPAVPDGDQAGETGGDAVPPVEPKGPPLTRWREIWPLPLLGVAGLLLASGVVTALMTRPDPVFTPTLDRAGRMIDGGAFDEAIAELNEEVFPYVGRPELSPAVEARFRTLLARALYGGQRELEFPQRVNDENIVDQYTRAERITGSLAARDVEKLARTLIALDELDKAEARLSELDDPAIRADVHKAIIDSARRRPAPDRASILMSVESLLDMPGLPEQDRVWALARRAEMQLGLGFTPEAINGLLRELPLLMGRERLRIGELFVMLGRAYYETGAFREARVELERADRDEVLDDSDPSRAQARLYLAHVESKLAEDESALRRARDRYDDLTQRASRTDAYLPALLGLGEVEAELGSDDESLLAFGALVDELTSRTDVAAPTRREVLDVLLGLARDREAAWKAGGAPHLVEVALRFLDHASSLYAVSEMPPDLLDRLSSVHESASRTTLGLPPTPSGERFTLDELGAYDPGTLQRAKRHLIQAASYARLHADRFIIDDYDEYADSIWRSAMLSDSAGDRQQAIASLRTFVETVEGDARNPEGRFLLGRMFQARGDYTVAAAYYKGLIDERESSPRPGIGRWADQAYVPLAQCYIQDTDEGNDTDAVRLLSNAVSGERGGPDRPEFRQAVLELGNLAFRNGRFAEAVERFEEALSRAAVPGEPDPSPIDEARVRYRLADAYRKLAEELEQRSEEPMTDRERAAIASDRESHLLRSIEEFTRVRDALDRVDPRALGRVDAIYLRNSHFYLGDCAFDRRAFEEAIEYYTTARARYPDDPAVLVALIQIVNSYLELGDTASARTANERARAFYQSLPEEAWDDPYLPLSRREWERWLDSSAKLHEGLAQGG